MLNENLEKLVGMIQDPAEQEAVRKDLESSIMRQDEYSRKMNEAAALKRQNDEWYAKYSTEYSAMADELARYRQGGAAQPEPQNVTEPATGAPNDIATAIKQAQEDARQARAEAERLKQLIESGAVVTQEYLNKYAPEMFDRYGTAIFATMDKATQAQNEYGLRVTPEDLVKKSGEYGGNLDQAYNALTEQAKQDKLKADIRKEIEAEYQAKLAVGAVPLAGGNYPIGANNPFEAYMSGSNGDNGASFANIKADGTGRLANAIASQMRAAGKY